MSDIQDSEVDWKELALALLVANSRALDMAEDYKRVAKALDAVLDAYMIPGKFPEYHEYVRAGLKKEWPGLWRALEEASKQRPRPTAG